MCCSQFCCYILYLLYIYNVNVITLSWITLNVELRYEIHTNCLGSNSNVIS